MKKLLLLIALQFIAFHPAHAQQSVIPYCYNSAGTTPITQWIPCSSSVPFPVDVTNSITASLAGWTPAGNYATPLSVSNSSSNVALPTNTGSVALYNTGTVAAYCKLGGSSVAATTSDEFLPGNSAVSYAVGSNTYVACITASSTTTVNISGGSGLLAGFGGGGGASGSNAAAGATGSSVPSSASYNGLNLSGTLRGQTGVNPSGSVYAAQNDISSIAGTTATVNSGAVGAGSLRVAVGQDTSTIAGSAPGTAGTASANVMTIQGVASMTPVQVSQATASNLNATVVGTGTFAVQATLQASATTAIGKVDPNTIATWGLAAIGGASNPTNALVAGCTYNSSLPSLSSGQSSGLQCNSSGELIIGNTNANGQATMANSSPVVLASNQSVADPCMFQAKSNVAIASSSGNTQLVAGSSGKKVYVCSFHLIAAAAAVVNLIEGTGSACTTANEAAVWGSTTAANGESLAANGGLTYGNGQGTIGVTATAANGICLLQSGTTALAGNVTYVQQ